ncbi:MAG: adenosylcobinamide-GDP ribazoletransferase [Candidatus Omnitrophota bacterium]|nr:adenosylcobinamide-GDP ribazoletransferase [Candidatus Omnitrophota bacterium]
MKYLLIAFQFLTILSFRAAGEIKDKDYGKSLAYFPVVGMVIGIILSAIALRCGFLPKQVLAAVVLIFSVFFTGALHLDGFADTCDGFYGVRPKEEILRIMRDARAGVMAVIGVALLLLLKFSLISSMPKNILWRSLIMMCCLSRWAQAGSCLLPYSRNEGKAELFIKYARKKDIIIGGVFAIIVSCVLFGLKGALIFFVSLVPALLFIRCAKSKINGMTGDTIGAINEITEASALFSVFILGLPR